MPQTHLTLPAPHVRQLLMNLLRVAEHGQLDTAGAIRAGALFDISANHIRVTLNRLLAAGLATSPERGLYQLGPEGLAMAQDVGAWRQAEATTRPWQGSWVLALTHNLGRTDRPALRQRERALALLGMRELTADVHVRPDNLAGGVAQVRARLTALGMGAEALVLGGHDFDAPREQLARKLWPTRALLNGYRDGHKQLQASLRRLPRLGVAQAAQEAYMVGNAAIRGLVFDPLLPEPLVDPDARQRYREAVVAYEAEGRAIWQRFLAG